MSAPVRIAVAGALGRMGKAILGVAAPLVIYLVMGERAAAILQNLRTWLVHHNAAIMAVLLLVLGAKLVGDGISGF